MANITPESIQAEYQQAVSYNAECNGGSLYERVRQNENFFIGNQWEGVNAPDLDKPVINILKRVVCYFLASIVSDDVGAELSLFGGESEDDELAIRIVTQQITAEIERTRAKQKNREIIRDAAVDGDGCIYVGFNPDAETGQDARGELELEVLGNTDVFFGNPQLREVQKQPFILIQTRRLVSEVREEARLSGVPETNYMEIMSDDDPNGINTEQEQGKVTVLTRFWREKGEIWFCRAAGTVMIVEPVSTGCRLYPLAWMNWDRIKGSYHGQAAVTGLIPNQIFINKLFAMCMEHVKKLAFPKVIYNKGYFPGGFTNRVGEAIGVGGPADDTTVRVVQSADMSAQVMQMLDKVISYTRDTMGASDAALGNVRPDNTSAIIATQKASAMPLELQRMDFYQFVEDYIRIMLDVMRARYGVRRVSYETDEGKSVPVEFDFSKLGTLRYKLNVNIGASTYWSELMQMQTLDNLMAKHVISDVSLYLDSIPSQYLPNKQKLLAHVKERQEAEQGASADPEEAAKQMAAGMMGGI